MSDRLAAVGLRILAPRSVLLGTGDSDALQNADTTELPDGSLCWASDQSSYYVLHKSSVSSPSGTIVVAPGSGPGRWIILGSGAGGSQIIVPDVAALAALPAPDNGESAFVLTVRSGFVFKTGSALTADAISVVNASDTSGQWLRTPVADLSWAYQGTWYVSSAGNDENVGDTALSPLKTAAELTRRIGGQTLQQSVTVSQLTDLPEYVNLTVTLVSPSDQFLWVADPTALTTVFTGSGGLSAVTAISAATNTPLSITDTNTGGLNWANWLGAFRIRITSAGPRLNAVGYVGKVLSATQARCTPFTVFDPATSNPLAAPNVTPQIGDHYVVETLPGVLGMNLFVRRNGTNLTNTTIGAVDSIDLGKGIGADSALQIDCSYGSSLIVVSRSILEAGRISGFNCAVNATLFSSGAVAIADVFFISAGGAVLTSAFGSGQKIQLSFIQGDFLINGGASLIPENQIALAGSSSGVGIFDATNAGIFMHEEQDAALVTINDSGNPAATVYGSGNAFGVDLTGSHQINYELVRPSITGVGGDIRMGLDIFSWVQAPIVNVQQLSGITNRQGINCASIYRTLLGAAVTDTNVFTSSPPQKGLYQIAVYLAVTTAGAAGDTASVTLKWTDDSQAETVVVINTVSVAAKGFFAVAQYVETNGVAAVTYALSFPTKTGAPQVSLRIVATPLQSANV